MRERAPVPDDFDLSRGGLSSWGLSPFSALLAPEDVLGFLQ